MSDGRRVAISDDVLPADALRAIAAPPTTRRIEIKYVAGEIVIVTAEFGITRDQLARFYEAMAQV